MRHSFITLAASRFKLALFMSVSMFATLMAIEQSPTSEDPSKARDGIRAMYAEWGRARIVFDKEVVERILAPEFYVLLDGEKIARDRFVAMVTQKGRGPAQLTRFDVEILTVQRAKDGWTLVIGEKLEYEIPGGEEKVYSYWVTRDGCRKEGEKWVVTYSEAIGHETWRSGSKPPIEGW